MNPYFSDFYHGTDARILRMPNHVRQSYIKFAKEVIDSLGTTFLPLFQIDNKLLMLKEQLGNCYESFVDSIMHVYMNKIGYEHYQYDNLYVTTWKPDAVTYSIKSYAFGEIGMIAYGIVSGMMAITKFQGNSLDMFLPMKPFIDFAESPPAPVVLRIDDIDKSFLRNEDGTIIDIDKIVCGASYRYLKNTDLSKCEIVHDEEIQFLNERFAQFRKIVNAFEMF